MPSKRFAFLCLILFPVTFARAQSSAPDNAQVVMYSATLPNGTMPSVTFYNGQPCSLASTCTNAELTGASNFKPSPAIVGLSSAISASIGTELSIIPIASPSSAVIVRTDAATGAPLPASVTLGPIFAERAETIGRHRFYLGITTQEFHFTSLNGESLRSLQMLDSGGQTSTISLAPNSAPLMTYPATYNISLDARLSQNVAFLTYGLTGRVDVSLGLQVVHASISSRVYDGLVYVGNGFNNTGNGNCWCISTFTPGSPPGSPSAPNGSGLILPQVNDSDDGATGFGDMLLRVKGTIVQRASFSLAVGTDLRLPTGDAKNFLGTGATAVRPFIAASFYTKALGHGVVLAPHLNAGWQVSGKSILAGQISATPESANGATLYGPPFTFSKGYLPDVFSWAAGTELALGNRNTVVVDFLGNQIGWYHGIPNTAVQSVPDVPEPQAPYANTTASGLVYAGRVSFGQYSGAFGYKAKVYGNLVATFNVLVRFDDNGLRDRAVPLFGLGYTF